MAIHGERALAKARVEIGNALQMAIVHQVVVHELRAAMSLATIGGGKPTPLDLAVVKMAISKFCPGSSTPDLTAATALPA